MMGAFFAMFTSDVMQIAKMVNFMSALASRIHHLVFILDYYGHC